MEKKEKELGKKKRWEKKEKSNRRIKDSIRNSRNKKEIGEKKE